jgi:hypothetical protein
VFIILVRVAQLHSPDIRAMHPLASGVSEATPSYQPTPPRSPHSVAETPPNTSHADDVLTEDAAEMAIILERITQMATQCK